MRALCCMLLTLALPGVAQAQDQRPPQYKVHKITLDDLKGTTLDATISWIGQARWLKNNEAYAGEDKWQWTINIGSDASLNDNIVREARTGGYVKTRNYAHAGVIGRPKVGPEGKQAGLWTLQDNILTGVTVYRIGARIARFALARSAAGLTCRLTVSYVREVGKGHATAANPFGAGEVEIVSMKQTSSTCGVSKG